MRPVVEHRSGPARGEAYDSAVVGGGVVGVAVALGLAQSGARVVVLDEGDEAFRATRGNFGLVWVQGKGAGHAPYARWTLEAAAAWPAFAAMLQQTTRIDVALQQPGGLTLCLDDDELAARAGRLRGMGEALGLDYPFQVLRARDVKDLLPQVGPEVVGAIYSPLDGHASPLKLLHALVAALQAAGGALLSGAGVSRIEPLPGGGFVCHSARGALAAPKVVLAAGLGNLELARPLGLRVPVRPVRGQIVVTERLQPFLTHPTLHVRQTDEGVVQIGDSKEDVGLDDGTSLHELSRIAARALRCFPCLRQANVVRAWGALRVMTPDGLPIYEESARFPGAYVVTCHSGITLAPLHATSIASWVAGATEPAGLSTFKTERFDVQAT